MANEMIFRIVFWTLLALLFIERSYFTQRVRAAGERVASDRAAIEREGKGLLALRIASFLLLLAALALYATNPAWVQALNIPMPPWLRWAGLALSLASLALLTWTQWELGKMWSAQLQLRSEHHLVTTGPYARVRHPLYTAVCAWGISLALLTANWMFVILAAAVCILLPARVPQEERMMIEHFGDDYRDYMQRTGRFLPK